MHNRLDDRAHLRRKLTAGVSIHMPAPRRIGKTWTVNRLASDLRSAGWVAVEVDVEGLRTPREFAKELCVRIEEQFSIQERLKEKLLNRFATVLGGLHEKTPLEALSSVDPIEYVETLISALNDRAEQAVILIDEVAYFFLALAEQNKEDAHAFAYQLRAIQQRYKKVRWVLTGSIGLNEIARRYGLEGAFVDLETYVLEPFSKEQALSFMRDGKIQQQFNHVFDASDEDFAYLFEHLGWLAPYYLKMVANEVRPSAKGADGVSGRATADDFEAAFAKLLLHNRRSEFAVWPEHIRKNLLDGDRRIALCVLNVLSRHTEGETEDTLLSAAQIGEGNTTKRGLKDVLSMLLNDGLITRVDGRYAFRSGLIRRYWHEYEAE